MTSLYTNNTPIGFQIFGLILLGCIIVRLIIGTHESVHKIRHGNDDIALNAISSHSCFESNKVYKFDSGEKTPKQEFARRLKLRLQCGGGELTQGLADRIADDIAAEVRSLNSIEAGKKHRTFE